MRHGPAAAPCVLSSVEIQMVSQEDTTRSVLPDDPQHSPACPTGQAPHVQRDPNVFCDNVGHRD